MRKLLLVASLVLICNLAWGSQTGRYSLRDAGFVDVEARPYRLVLLARDLAAAPIKERCAALERELVHSNVVLQAVQAKIDGATPDKKPIAAVDAFIEPRFWLISPDDRAIPFDPTVSMQPLLDSPLRQLLQARSAEALCVLLFLESTDDAANRQAKGKAEQVLAKINQARRRFEKAPAAEVKLLSLAAAERPRERWTLWGLGEDAQAIDVPKLAVVFGQLRRAGKLFEGSDWDEAELFARVAGLSATCEGGKGAIGPQLPLSGRTDWPAPLPFDPKSDAVKREVGELLDKPIGQPGRLTFEKVMAWLEPGDEEHQPPLDPIMGVGQNNDPAEQGNEPVAAPAEHKFEPPLVAGEPFAIVMFVIGLAGWIGLGLSVWVLERKQPGPSPQI